MRRLFAAVLLCLSVTSGSLAQGGDEREREFEDLNSFLWLGSYNQFRLADKWFWRAEFHYRRGNYEEIPYVGRMAQIYNRHAIQYLVSPTFNISAGVVLRLDFTPQPGEDAFEYVVPEPRFWHEYLWVVPWPRFQMYHRIRLEHRWSRRNNVDSEWIYRDRYRYKFFMKIPLNSMRLEPGTIFFNPDVEILMHSGKAIIDSPFEDLRLYPSFGYIQSPRVTYTAGIMYTTGQSINDGSIYRQRWVVRINAYINLDFRSEAKKVPSIKLSD